MEKESNFPTTPALVPKLIFSSPPHPPPQKKNLVFNKSLSQLCLTTSLRPKKKVDENFFNYSNYAERVNLNITGPGKRCPKSTTQCCSVWGKKGKGRGKIGRKDLATLL